MSEFDDSKRSCRRRLAGHNERRRKSSHDSVARNSSQGTLLLYFFLSDNSQWTIKTYFHHFLYKLLQIYYFFYLFCSYLYHSLATSMHLYINRPPVKSVEINAKEKMNFAIYMRNLDRTNFQELILCIIF